MCQLGIVPNAFRYIISFNPSFYLPLEQLIFVEHFCMQESGLALSMHSPILLSHHWVVLLWELQLVHKWHGRKCRNLEIKLNLTSQVSKWRCEGSVNSLLAKWRG